MKIVIVLCFLATFVIAVPVYQENVFESLLSNPASSTKHETKSAFPDTPGLFPEHGIKTIHSTKKSSKGTSLEAKSLRRPIIIKRKLGYHVYRDSDEEMAYAEPGENCREQVKFKLCDHEPVSSSKNGFKSPTFKCFNNHNMDNGMENSIKMAKDAVEHLQKDLKRMENFSPKIANPNIEDIESNTGLHHDIEIAREALEHIEQNFESVNLEANKANELQTPKVQDEERLTRWREAIENIHKNFEIVKNIEDAFKSDNHVFLLRSDSRKTVESEKREHLENNEEAYNEDKILKSASNEDRIAQFTPKTENVDKEMGNDMFVSPTENREEKLRLHSDSLKSDVNYKDSFLRSDVSELESTKHVSNVPKESNEYVPKKSLSVVPNNSEHEKSVNDHISDDYELLPKESSILSDSFDKNVQIEEQKTIDKSEWTMKTALPERDNKNLLIKMKSVKEILGNKKDQEKVATSNEENINEYEELFKSKNENSPLERLSLLPSTNIEKAPTNIENFKNSDAVGEEKIYFDKRNNKVIENEENKSKFYNTNMRLSNDQLEPTDQPSADKYVNIVQNVLQSPYLVSLKEKNALDGEENVQIEHKTQHTIKENHELYDSLKGLEKEVKDDAQNFKRTDEYKNMKSSEVQDGKIDSQIIQNQEMNKFSLLNDDSLKKVDIIIPELYKTVSEASNEHILNDGVFKNRHSIEEEMRIPITQNKDENEDSKMQFSKSVPELNSEPMMSTLNEKVDFSDNLHFLKSGVRLSQTQNEKLQLNEQYDEDEHVPTRFDMVKSSDDTKTQFLKSVPELQPYPMASLLTDKVDINNDQHSHSAEGSMRSSESHNEKMQSNKYQKLHELLPMGLDIERYPEERTWQSPKSVPELPYDPMVSMPTEKVDISDKHHTYKGKESMRSSESQSKKLELNEYQDEPRHVSSKLDIESSNDDMKSPFFKSVSELESHPLALHPTEKLDVTNNRNLQRDEMSMRSAEVQNENQEVHEPVAMGLDIERYPEERTWQSPKSVPELPSDSMQAEKIDFTDDHHAHKEETNMRSSDSQNEKLLLNEYQDEPEHVASKLDIEYSPDDMKSNFFKSVPELESHPLALHPTEKVDVTNNRNLQGDEMSMRSAEVQNENQEVHEPVAMGLDIERYPEERTWQSPKSVPELPSDSMQTEKIDFTDDHHAHKEETNMRSSDSQNEKLLLNEYQDEPEHVASKLDIEYSPDDMKSNFFKSVPELESLPLALHPTEKVDVTNNRNLQGDEMSMRSAEVQNENQEVHEPVAMGLDIERYPEERTWQSPKSVPELPSDSMQTEKIDYTDDHHVHKEETNLRSAEGQNEQNILNGNEEVHEPVAMGLDIERYPEERTWKYPKSVPELPSDSMQTEKIDYTDDHHAYKEETNMRSAEVQNEQNLLNGNEEVHKPVAMGLDIERYPEERTRQSPKSVPELPSDSMQTEKIDFTDDHHTLKVETNMRSSESQSKKLELNEYQDEPRHVSSKLDIESSNDDMKSPFFKSVSELESHPLALHPTEKLDVTNNRNLQRDEMSMRSAEVQNENQEVHEPVAMGLDIERYPEERTWQSPKSVPELPSDSMQAEKIDFTDDHHAHKEETNMRSSDSQNEKLLLNEYQDEPEHVASKLDIEYSPDDMKSNFFKSVPELESHPLALHPTEKVDVTNNRNLQGDEMSMRSAEVQNENQEVHEPVAMGLDIERYPEERTWQSPKSVPELPSDSMQAEKIDFTDDHHAHKEETNMRSSDSQNEKLLLNEYQDEPEHVASKLDIEYNSDDMKSNFLKSVPELESHPLALHPTEKVDVTNNQNLQGDETSMRSAEIQNENQEVHKPVAMGLDIERYPEERTWQSPKSVPELPFDSMHTEKIEITDDHHAHKEETNMRSAEVQNENQEVHEPVAMGLDLERYPEKRTWQSPKSVPELPSDSMQTEKIDFTGDHHARKVETNMRSSESQSEKLLLNEYQDEPEPVASKLDIEYNPDDLKSKFLKSVPELESHPLALHPTEKLDVTNNRNLQGDEMSMRSAEVQNENQEVHEPVAMGSDIERYPAERTWQSPKSVPELPSDSMQTEKIEITDDHHAHKEETNMRSAEVRNENQEVHEPEAMGLDIERYPEERTWQSPKSVPELPSDSMQTEKIDFTGDHHARKVETNMRSSESQSEKLLLNEYQDEPEHVASKLDIEYNPDDLKSKFLKSVPELESHPLALHPTEKLDVTNNRNMQGDEMSMRSAEVQNENQEVHEPVAMGSDIERYPAERTWQSPKSVPELPSDSMQTEIIDYTDDHHAHKEETNMRSAEVQNEKNSLNENQEVHEPLAMGLDIERYPEERTRQSPKSVPDLPYDTMISIPTEKVDIPKDHYSNTGDVSVRVSETHNEKLQLNDMQEGQEPLLMRLDMTNRPENLKWQVSKSVPELPFDPMVSMSTDKVEITKDQKSLKEENRRLSQNQDEGRQFYESHGLQDFFPTKLGIDNHPEHRTLQFFKSAPELYMTRTNINRVSNENFYFPKDARLSQNQNERQQIYFNQHLYEPHSPRIDNENNLEGDSLPANKVRFSYIQNPIKEETNMRLSQNQNENKEIQYPSRTLGLSNEHLNREENAEYIMNDFMPPSVEQHQQIHENSNPMLRSSYERQHLSHNFKSWPEHKMLLPTSFEFNNGQNVLNEHMRINKQQSRDPEPMENQNLHNSLSMRWNTANQHRDPSSKTFKFNSDFDHNLHRSNEFDNEQFIPHEVIKTAISPEYRTRPQSFGDHILDNTQSSPWYQTKQHNDYFASYYKTIPEGHEEYKNPHFRNHLHREDINHNLNDGDAFSSHDSPSNRARLHKHMQTYHQEKSTNTDSSMDPNVHLSMGEPFAKPGTEFNNMHLNHPHGTARFGAALPIAGVNSGAVGVFPTANAGGCGIPLLLSCSPSVVSGSLARPHIAGPIFKSAEENFKYYMKRDAKNIGNIPDIKIQKASFPHNHGTGKASEI